jgi:hypothetical protein
MVTVVLSSSFDPTLSQRAALEAYPGLVREGSEQLSGSITADDLVSNLNPNIHGITWTEPVGIFNGTAVNPRWVSYLGVENDPSGIINGSGLEASASNSALSFQSSEQTGWFINDVVGNWFGYNNYIAGASAVFLIALPFEAARRSDSVRSKMLDNTFGLSRSEWDSLAILSQERGDMTGSQALERLSARSGVSTWGAGEGLLLKFERLGLLRRETVTNHARPVKVWRCLV